jgi:hypothetical protein
MATAGGQPAWPRWWPGGLAWALWALGMVGLAVVPWLDRLLRQAGRTWSSSPLAPLLPCWRP